MENRLVVLQRVLAQLEQDVDFISKYISIVHEDTMTLPSMRPQSADQVVLDNTGTTEDTHQTVTFHDENGGESVGVETAHPAYVLHDTVDSADLCDFLSRPVRIASVSYTEVQSLGTNLYSGNPWNAFFSTPAIKYKLNNFGFIRCNLKLKFIVNASPFYYGAALASYQPLQNLTPTTIVDDGSTRQLIPYSQRPHLWMFPQNSEGGEMTLPFFYHKAWLPLKVASEFTDMGELDIYNYAVLQSANGATGQGMTITVYAWAEDVVLSSSTTSLAMQSQDEYGTGPVSAPASAVANAAGMLKKIPIIGKFATATQIGARAISQVASLFGFTNVPVIEPSKPFRPNMFPPLAAPDLGYPVDKLTLDIKNELTVDPSVLGIPGDDELEITHMISRESYLFQATWSTTDTVDTLLAYSRVNPNMFATGGDVNNSVVYNTPMSMVSELFQYWRGDIEITIRIIKSPYHRGRLRLSYDPLGDATTNLVNTAQTSTTVFTQVVDLGTDDVVKMRIPYQQALPWLRVPNSYNASNVPYNTTAPTFNVDNGTDNGCFTVRVMNILSAPVATAPITLLFSVAAADNMEFGAPIPLPGRLVNFQVQSQDETKPDIDVVMGKTISSLDSERTLINFGESVRSLRPLFRRSNFTQSLNATTTGTGLQQFIYKFHKMPPYSGFDPNGESTATAIVGTGTKKYNYVQVSPLQWVAPAFVAYRGSTIWHFNTNALTDDAGFDDISVTRIPQYPGNNTQTISSSTLSATSASTNRSAYFQARSATAGGTTVTNQRTQSGISVSVPNYSNYLFQSTNPGNSTNPTGTTTSAAYDGSYYDVYSFNLLTQSGTNALTSTATSTLKVDAYMGIGTDFNLYFFLNAPCVYKQTSWPTPV